MKPAAFDYYLPDSLDEAVSLLGEHGDDAKVLAGGQSLVPLMNMRLAQPGVLVDIGELDELAGIRGGNGTLEIGATARQGAVLRSSQVASFAPLIPAAVRHVGHEAIRNRGTFGGSVAHADPSAEAPAVLLALDAEIVARGPNGERTIAATDFFVSHFSTALAPDEILTAVRFPQTGNGGWSFKEVARRHGDFALVGTAVTLRTSGDAVESARVVLFGVSDVPVRALEAEAVLAGARVDAATATAASRAGAEALDPPNDVHASSTYRKEAAAALIERAILEAGGVKSQ